MYLQSLENLHQGHIDLEWLLQNSENNLFSEFWSKTIRDQCALDMLDAAFLQTLQIQYCLILL